LGVINYFGSAPFAVLTALMDYVFRLLPNPVNINEIKLLFSDSGIAGSMDLAIGLVLPNASSIHTLPFAKIYEFATHENAVVRQVFTHALSSKHDLWFEPFGDRYLEMIEALFHQENPSARYVALIALYHINCFGTRFSVRSIELMEKVAALILRVYKGRLDSTDGKRTYNFNVIGTLGRVLIKHDLPPHSDTLDFAIRELERAKETSDPEHYLYVVKNVGLLGTIAPPRRPLGVMRHVLEDVGQTFATAAAPRLEMDFGQKATRTILDCAITGLAQIRVRSKSEVDAFLDELADPGKLRQRIRGVETSYDLGLYSSWMWEELVQKTLVNHQEYAQQILELLRRDFFPARSLAKGISRFLDAFLKFDRERFPPAP
jgi:hypothetical protein